MVMEPLSQYPRRKPEAVQAPAFGHEPSGLAPKKSRQPLATSGWRLEP
jgi:hypothetical protein